MSETTFDPRRSRWIPWAFVGGFAVVIAVNAILIWASISTFTGVTVTRAYERGRGYDQVLAEAARQDALGWTARVQLADGRLRVTAVDRDGRPISGRIEGVLRRPVTGEDLAIDFRSGSAGAWTAPIGDLPHRGVWEARLTLWGPGEQPLDIRERLFVP